MAVRMLREDGTRRCDNAPLYCMHPACILGWNTSVLKALERYSATSLIVWLAFKENDGEFGARCCVQEGPGPLEGDEVMLR